MLYAFTARFVKRESQKFNLFVTVFVFAGFGASFIGFITLVSTVYPLTGYLGFIHSLFLDNEDKKREAYRF
ncbi:hypothetical protein AN957_15135 [Cytobacillus solani]|uniref:Uncharacterized protein n=1 Tax=Cytobacillus solani TaxID=1637975 RepID=A0A0Q3T8G5_9BACI|nr:hypothetical protein AN957_15135 [Cytobacillus solani]